jgi:hypothetical protein
MTYHQKHLSACLIALAALFSTASMGAWAATAPALGAAIPFGFLSSAALTNQGDATVITGDAGTTAASSSITGLHDSGGRTYTETCPTGGAAVGCGLVTGTIFASDAPTTTGDTTAAAAAAAALVAYNNLSPAAQPGGLDVRTHSLVGGGGSANELGGRTLAPGIYRSTTGDYQITTGDLTLEGNANAVWVFQMDSTLLVSSPTGPLLTVPRTVRLIGGALASNVFWYVGSAATINTGSYMVGTIISSATTTFGTSDTRVPPLPASAITTLIGRALVLNAGATMVNTVITVPLAGTVIPPPPPPSCAKNCKGKDCDGKDCDGKGKDGKDKDGDGNDKDHKDDSRHSFKDGGNPFEHDGNKDDHGGNKH